MDMSDDKATEMPSIENFAKPGGRVTFVTRNPLLSATEEEGGEDDKGDTRNSQAYTNHIIMDKLARKIDKIPDELNKLIFDAVPVNFDFGIFVRQIFIQVVPFLGLLFQPCLDENMKVAGYSLALLMKPETRERWLINSFPQILIILIIACTFGISGEPEPPLFPYSRRTDLLSGNMFVPVMMYLLHRITVCFKYATLHPSEYARYNQASFDQALVYQDQLQLLTSWGEKRHEMLHDYLIKSAEVRANIDLSDLRVKIANPKASKLNKYQFVQWQAYMKGTSDLSQFKDEELDPELVDVIHTDTHGDGDYYISARDLFVQIIKNVDATKQHASQSYKRMAIFEKGILIVYPFAHVITYLSKPHVAAAVRPVEWLLLITELIATTTILYYLVLPVSLFFILLLNDNERRLHEAEVLKEMARMNETIFDEDTVRLGRNSLNKRGLEVYGKMLVNVKDKGHPEVVLYADRVVNDQLYKNLNGTNDGLDSADDAEEDHSKIMHNLAPYIGRTPRVDLKAFGKTNLIAWLGIRETFRNLGLRHKFRMDFFSVLLTLANSLFLLLIIAGNIMQSAASMEGASNPETNLRFKGLIEFTSTFSFQILILSTFFTFCLLGNVGAAVRVNEKFESHQYVLQKAIIVIEKEYSILLDTFYQSTAADQGGSIHTPYASIDHLEDMADTTDGDNGEAKEEESDSLPPSTGDRTTISWGSSISRRQKLRQMRETLDALEVAIMSVQTTDNDVPVTILSIRADWTLYLTIVTAIVSVAASLTTAFSNPEGQS